MKINKLILAIFIATATLFVACEEFVDTEVVSPAVSDGNAAVRFADDNITAYELEPTVADIKLTVIRTGSSSAIEVPIVVIENTENSFDVPASLSFPAGKDTVVLTLPINKTNAPLGDEITIAIQFGVAFSNPYMAEYNSFYGKVTILNWQPFATGSYYAAFFPATLERVLHRAQGTNKYRFFNLFAEGYHLDFVWAGAKALTFSYAKDANGYHIFHTGYVHPTYGPVRAHIDGAVAYTFYDAASDSFTMDAQWRVDAGSFGWKTDVFTITTRH